MKRTVRLNCFSGSCSVYLVRVESFLAVSEKAVCRKSLPGRYIHNESTDNCKESCPSMFDCTPQTILNRRIIFIIFPLFVYKIDLQRDVAVGFVNNKV